LRLNLPSSDVNTCAARLRGHQAETAIAITLPKLTGLDMARGVRMI